MKTLFVPAIVLLTLAAIAAAVVLPRLGKSKRRFKPKLPLTAREQAMYWRLTKAFPHTEYIVLTQVSFGALLSAAKGISRKQFAHKRADFVLLDRKFRALAVIELDDGNNKGRAAESERDTMLQEAGYRVVRYDGQLPDVKRLHSELLVARPVRPESSGAAAADAPSLQTGRTALERA